MKPTITKDNIFDYVSSFDIKGNKALEDAAEGRKKIDNTYGYGFEFYLGDEDFITKPELDSDNKLVVRIDLTSWKGLVGGAKHYYGTIKVVVKNHCDKSGKLAFGYLGGVEKDKEFDDIFLQIQRPVTDEELATANDPHSDWYHYVKGMNTQRFDSREDIVDTAMAIIEYLFDTDKCSIKIRSNV